ncbi:hypothetical protein HY771_02455 [Candidatus Uhrbacteria bacterium]|nr:hypothetical protein [Candidatus Uhrbacteria bacterium]
MNIVPSTLPDEFDLGTDDSPPIRRLVIVPDQNNIGWTHLHTVLSVCTIQDLPRPLRCRLSPLAGVLRKCRIPRALFDLLNPRELLVVQIKECDCAFRPQNSADHQESLKLTLWWIEYVSRLKLTQARAGQGIRKTRAYWLCPECGTQVGSDREWCKTRGCLSWDKLHACSGLERPAPLSEAT